MIRVPPWDIGKQRGQRLGRLITDQARTPSAASGSCQTICDLTPPGWGAGGLANTANQTWLYEHAGAAVTKSITDRGAYIAEMC